MPLPSAAAKPPSNWRFILALLAALCVAYVFFFYPISFHWGTQMPQARGSLSARGIPDNDAAFWLWCLWWSRFAVGTLHQTPFVCDFQNFPLGVTLANSPIAAPYGVLSIPFAHVSVVALYNFWMAVSVVLTSLAVALLALEMGYGRKAAVFAAACLFLTPFQRAQMVGHLNVASTCWPVLALYFVVRMRRRGGIGALLPASAMAAMTLYTDHYHALFLSTMLALYIAWQVVAARGESIRRKEVRMPLVTAIVVGVWLVALSIDTLRANLAFLTVAFVYLVLCVASRAGEWALWRQVVRFAAFAALACVLSLPLLIPILYGESSTVNDPAVTLMPKLYFSNTPLTPFLTPTLANALNRALGYTPDWIWRFRADEEFACFPGIAPLLLGVFILLRARKVARGWVWAFLALSAYFFSLGMVLRFPEAIQTRLLPTTGVILPGSIYIVPFGLQDLRAFSRFGFYFDLMLALFVAANWEMVLSRVRLQSQRAQVIAVALFILLTGIERFERGMPAFNVQVPKEYRSLASLPAGAMWFLPDSATPQALYLQSIFRMPIVNCMTSREDSRYRILKENSQTWRWFQWLATDETAHSGIAVKQDGPLKELQEMQVRYLVIVNSRLPEHKQLLFRQTLGDDWKLALVRQGSELSIYEVPLAPHVPIH